MDAHFVGTLDGVARHTIDYYIDPCDEFATKLKDGKAPVFTIWFRKR